MVPSGPIFFFRLGLLLLLGLRLIGRAGRCLVHHVGAAVAVGLVGQTQVGLRKPHKFGLLEGVAFRPRECGQISCPDAILVGWGHGACVF